MNKKLGLLTSIPNYSLTYFTLSSYYLASSLTNWQLISNVKGQTLFGDLNLILSYSKCHNNESSALLVSQCESSFVYGQSLLTIMKFLDINHTFVNVIGYCFMIVTLICAIELFRLIKPFPSFKHEIVTILYLASPPVVLLFERGNLDSLIFILTTISVFLFLKKYSLLSQFLIFLATIIKFYPILIAYINYRLSKNKVIKIGNLLLLIFSILFTITFLFTVNLQFIPNPTRVAFGSSLFGKSLNQLFGIDISRIWQLLIGVMLLILSYIFLSIVSKKYSLLAEYKFKLVSLSPTSKYILFVYSSVYFFTFFLSMNFDYRLIFLLPIYCIILSMQFKYKMYFVLISISSVWFSFQIYKLEIIGDLFLFLFTFIYFFLVMPDYKTTKIFLQKNLAFIQTHDWNTRQR